MSIVYREGFERGYEVEFRGESIIFPFKTVSQLTGYSPSRLYRMALKVRTGTEPKTYCWWGEVLATDAYLKLLPVAQEAMLQRRLLTRIEAPHPEFDRMVELSTQAGEFCPTPRYDRYLDLE